MKDIVNENRHARKLDICHDPVYWILGLGRVLVDFLQNINVNIIDPVNSNPIVIECIITDHKIDVYEFKIKTN